MSLFGEIIMDAKDIKTVEDIAKENYRKSEPWPETDVWHSYTYNILHEYVQAYLNNLKLENNKILLNAGCG